MSVRQIHQLAEKIIEVNKDSARTLINVARVRIQSMTVSKSKSMFWAQNQILLAAMIWPESPLQAYGLTVTALPILRKAKDSHTLVTGYQVLALIAQDTGNYTRALDYLAQAIDVANKIPDDTLLCAMYFSTAQIYDKYGKKHEYYRAAKNSFIYAQKTNNPSSLGASYYTLGKFFYKYSEWGKAVKYFGKSVRILEGHIDPVSFIWALTYYGKSLLYTDSLNRSVFILEKARKLSVEVGDSTLLYRHAIFLSDAYLKAGYLKLATQTLADANRFGWKPGDDPAKKSKINLDLKLAGLYYKANKLILAEDALDRFNCSSQKANWNSKNIDAAKDAALLYYKLGSFKKAFDMLRKWGDFKSGLHKKSIELALVEVEERYAIEKAKNEQIGLINLALVKSKKNQSWLAFGLIMLLVVGGSSAWYFRSKALKDRGRVKELQLKQVLAAQEEERQRLARELHDGIGQSLAALKMRLEMSSENKISVNTMKRLDALCQEVRTLSHQMMPMSLQEHGLKNALALLITQSLQSKGINTEFVVDGFEQRIDNMVEVQLYRIAQELVNNIIRHAQAREVGIQLLEQPKRIVFIIEDDGIGFSETRRSKGIGLANIQSRLDSISGRMEMHSEPGNGTFIRIMIPLTVENRITA